MISLKLCKFVLFFLFLCQFIVSCVDDSSFNAVEDHFEPFDWEIATPSSQGLNDTILSYAADEAASFDFLRGMIIVRNEYIVSEDYFTHYTKDDPHKIYSVTKSFMSALIGIAIKLGLIDNVDQKILDFFPDYDPSEMDPRMAEVTIKHLLTMTSGINANSINYPFYAIINWMETILKIPLDFDPGDDFLYSSYSTHLLSGIVANASGLSTQEFAERYLLGPLGIRIYQWDDDPEGYHMGGTGMYLTPRDLARFGCLYLNNGSIDGRQVVSSEWIQESLQNHVSFQDWQDFKEFKYGYLWYHGLLSNHRAFCAIGYGGQLIVAFPDLNMCIVTICSGYAVGSESQGDILLEWINDFMLPAVNP